MPNKKILQNSKDMINALSVSSANVWVSTPSFTDVCLSNNDFNHRLLPNLSLFIFCGEILTNNTVSSLQDRFPKAQIINTYGPTESTVAVTEVIITPEVNKSLPLPVGKTKLNTTILIVDENHNPVPEGQKGEIMIAGDTVSTGYFGRTDLTKKAFETIVINNQKERCYFTGDEGYLYNNMLYYCGRIDLQVKLNGYRIELEEIESNIKKLNYVDNAIVIPCIRNSKVHYLAAFIVLREQISESDFKASLIIKEALKEKLPQYMIPKKIVFKQGIPITTNGKSDRKILSDELS